VEVIAGGDAGNGGVLVQIEREDLEFGGLADLGPAKLPVVRGLG
jgi:hypothetical protein